MQFNWNINNWSENEIPIEVRKPRHVAYVKSILKPLIALYSTFMAYRVQTLKKMRYNGQTIVLENLLNEMFDPIQKRITIVTVYDVLIPPYIFTAAEDIPLYVYTADEYDNGTNAEPQNYLNTWAELGTQYDFVVTAAVGSLTPENEIRLKATVRYYKIAGVKPYYRYNNNQPF